MSPSPNGLVIGRAHHFEIIRVFREYHFLYPIIVAFEQCDWRKGWFYVVVGRVRLWDIWE